MEKCLVMSEISWKGNARLNKAPMPDFGTRSTGGFLAER